LEGVRAEAAATNAQLQAMQALTDTALSHLALDDLLRELLGRVTAVMGVDTVGIHLLDADGQALTVRAARGLGEEDVGRVRTRMGQGFAGRIAARRAPLIMDAEALSAADFAGASPLLWERLRSLAGVPLLVEDPAEDHPVSRLVGVLGVGSATPHRFTAADVTASPWRSIAPTCTPPSRTLGSGRRRRWPGRRRARRRPPSAPSASTPSWRP